MAGDQLDLLRWQPPCKVIAFPLDRQVGKVRDVASKLMAKNTERHAEHYRGQVTESLIARLDRIGLSPAERDRQLTAFWDAVRGEVIKRALVGQPTGGAA